MSVFTTVTPEQLTLWLKNYATGTLEDLQGILSGIENTNYFVTTTQGRFVLTLFEKLTPSQLPFYLNLMAHLSSHGIPCPKPIADSRGGFLGELNGKPAALVTRINGAPRLNPAPAHCAAVGKVLAQMHLAGLSYPARLDNLRGPRWWTAAAAEIQPFLPREDAKLLQSEIGFQAKHGTGRLPHGVVHADLFRDNVLFTGEQVGGLIDFYFACTDALVYDVAITLNDWCMREDCTLDAERCRYFLEAYRGVRPLTAAEQKHWPVVLRAGALRFWVSRLYDFHLPRPGALTHAHDPGRFCRILQNHIRSEEFATELLAS
jgi:homoserine kinase type II